MSWASFLGVMGQRSSWVGVAELQVQPVVLGKGVGVGPWVGGAMPMPRRMPLSLNDVFNVLPYHQGS